MKEKKYFLCLTIDERREIIQSLIAKRNKLIQENRYTDAVDDVLCKITREKIKKIKIKI